MIILGNLKKPQLTRNKVIIEMIGTTRFVKVFGIEKFVYYILG